jgi:hypothetical protein
MEDKIKRNIGKTGMFMLIAALLPLLFLLLFRLPAGLGCPVAFVWQCLYIVCCIFVLVWGSTQVIWELPCRKFFRMLVFGAWLIFYPALCLGWFYLCGMCYFFIFHVH